MSSSFKLMSVLSVARPDAGVIVAGLPRTAAGHAHDGGIASDVDAPVRIPSAG
ncbi:hypothetical protein [Amycolatopsis sp. cmx-4-68]|uniref:hypothetical protein n=1 Tax=Amycolatopsis sp. cmx-4-68 TaxID=2790938 RepID=UPI00397B53E7